MMTPEHFQKLGEHLSEIDPILERFCEQHHLSQVMTGLGRFPRRRIECNGEINWYFDFEIELSHELNLLTKSIPKDFFYSVGTGGWIDIDGFSYGKQGSFFRQVPFVVLKQNLPSYFQHEYEVMSQWTVNTLKQEGKVGELDNHKQNHHAKKVDNNVIAKQAELTKHLTEIDFVVDWFCKDFGFRPIIPLTSANYLKIVKHSEMAFFLELKKDDKEDRTGFNEFLPDRSYSLRGGASLTVENCRYTKSLVLFQNWPLLSVKQELFYFLWQGHNYLSQWTTDLVKQTGTVHRTPPALGF